MFNLCKNTTKYVIYNNDEPYGKTFKMQKLLILHLDINLGVYLCLTIGNELKFCMNMVKNDNTKYVAPIVILGQLNACYGMLLCASKDPICPHVGTEDYDDGSEYSDDLFD